MGGAHQRSPAKRLLCKRPARRDGRRLFRQVRHLFRDDRRPGVRLRERKRELEADCAGSAGSAFGGCANAWVMPVWGGRPRPPTCALQFVIRPNGTAEKPALIRTSAFDLEVHCGADNEAAQKGAEYYSPGRKS